MGAEDFHLPDDVSACNRKAHCLPPNGAPPSGVQNCACERAAVGCKVTSFELLEGKSSTKGFHFSWTVYAGTWKDA